MNKQNHGKITRDALKETGLHAAAIDFIAKANQDSDHQSAAASMAGQHFCGPNTTQNVVQKCNTLVGEAMDTAALLTRRNNEEELTDARRREVWNCLPAPPNLKFCASTPKLLVLFNAKGYKNILKSKQKTYNSIIRQRQSSKDDVIHPNMHLDFKNSWADQAITSKAGVGGGGAYVEAERLARVDTLDWWHYFINVLVRLEEFNPRSISGASKWKAFKTRMTYKSRYADRYNDAGCDPNMALANLMQFNPGKTKTVQIENSRKVFNDCFGVDGRSSPVLNVLDSVFGWDAAIA
jgi:hypothetical protein